MHNNQKTHSVLQAIRLNKWKCPSPHIGEREGNSLQSPQEVLDFTLMTSCPTSEHLLAGVVFTPRNKSIDYKEMKLLKGMRFCRVSKY